MGNKEMHTKNKRKKMTTMNEMVQSFPGTGEKIYTPSTDLIDLQGKPIKNIREDEEVMKIIEYNKSVENIESEYSEESMVFLTGQILVRLYRRLPVENGLYAGYTVPVVGDKQLKHETRKDPFHFAHIGRVINYDRTYEKRDPWRLTVGDVVQVNPVESMTIIEKLIDIPYLRRQFKRYDETRTYVNLGYIVVTSQEIQCKLPKFNINEYHEEFFK